MASHNSVYDQEMFFREMESITPPPQERALALDMGPRQKSFPAYLPSKSRKQLFQQQAVKKYDPLSSSTSSSTPLSSTPLSSTPLSSISVSPTKELLRSESPVTNRERQSQSLIIIDWDDTLLPTTVISECQDQSMKEEREDHTNSSFTVPLTASELDSLTLPLETRQQIAQIEKHAIDFVRLCLSKADVVIVTNSDQGWVEYTGSIYMPMLLKFIQSNDIKIVSARYLYEAYFPDDLTMWKVQAFMTEIKTRENQLKTLVSIGDGEYERNAAKICAANVATIKVQAMKFVQCPDLEQLKKQFVLSESIITSLLPSHGSFDINLVA